jgi:hypothetical protein
MAAYLLTRVPATVHPDRNQSVGGSLQLPLPSTLASQWYPSSVNHPLTPPHESASNCSSSCLASRPSSCLASHSQSSDSDASLCVSSTALSGPTVCPTSVVDRKSRIAWLHRSSAKRSLMLNRFIRLPVACNTSAQRVFCWAFQRGQFLKRCCRVWVR